MFVILKTVRTDKKKIRKGKTICGVRIVNMGAGQCFYEVEIASGENGVNWAEVSDFVGNHGRNVLVADDVIIPDGGQIKRFDSSHFRNILLFNSLKLVFRELFYMGNRVRCIINDPKGLYTENLRLIVPYAARITIATENEFRYFSEIRDIYSVCGAGITLTDRIEDADDDTVIIDTSAGAATGKGIVFSSSVGFAPGRVDGFEDILEFCPSYIAPTDFLAAVHRFNSDKRLNDAVCRTFLFENKKFTLFETAGYIDDAKEKTAANKSVIFYI